MEWRIRTLNPSFFALLVVSFFFSVTAFGETTITPAVGQQHSAFTPIDNDVMGVRGWQDMHSHTWKTPEGHSVLFNKQLGSWTYAIPDKQGRLKSSSIVTEIPLKKEAFTSPLEQINTTAAASAEAQGGSYYQCLGASGHIKGLVRDSSGTTALEGIEVQAGRLSGWWYGPSFENWQHWTAVTDVNGAYELEVPEGFYQLSFFDPTGTYASVHP